MILKIEERSFEQLSACATYTSTDTMANDH